MPADYGTGEFLYLAEMQIIDTVGNQPGINVTEIANILGITKGTVSPVSRSLTKRGYLKKSRGGRDSRKVRVELTQKGQDVWRQYVKKIEEYVSRYAQGITFGEWAIFNEILDKLEVYIDIMLAEERNGTLS